MIDSGWRPPVSLYLHIPFCPYKCPYCDFATYVGGPHLVEPYVSALRQEIRATVEAHPGHSLDTVFFGGGTPSMLSPDSIKEILAEVECGFGIAAGAEISLEANPDAVDAAKLEGLRSAGVNRISLGVQSMDSDELKALGRGHSPEDVTSTMHAVRKTGFENLSLDLIYGTPGQTLLSWEHTLTGVLAEEPDHVSCYSLIVEPGTRFSRLRSDGRLPLPEDDTVADMYDMACSRLREAGFVHYEVANWARPGREARHNLAYWHDEEFFAAGVGAYDYLRPYRSVRVRGTKKYIEAIQAGGNAIAQRDLVAPADEKFETAVMRLRLLREGLDRKVYRKRFGEELDASYAEALRELNEMGFLDEDSRAIRLRESMVPLANEAWEKFLPPSEAGTYAGKPRLDPP
jgi:oxygen-independent coproporphyrinogen-3 oxidase